MALIAGTVLAWQVTTYRGDPVVGAVEAPEPEDPVPTLRALRERLQAPPLATTAEIVERPLFRENRRPYEPPRKPQQENPEPKAEQLPAPEVEVTGVILTPRTKAVIYRPKDGKRSERAAVGEQIDGWTVEKITDDGIVLVQGERRTTVPLKQFQSSGGGEAGEGAPALQRRPRPNPPRSER